MKRFRCLDVFTLMYLALLFELIIDVVNFLMLLAFLPEVEYLLKMALSPPKAWALQQCFLTSPVVADLPERLQYSQQNCT